MAKLSLVKTDPEREIDGVWVTYELDIELKIARIGNTAFDDLVRTLSEPHLKGIRNKRLKPEQLEAITKKAAAETLLVDWKNIEGEDGKKIKYSSKKALEFFDDPTLSDMYKFVVITANEAELYRQEIDEDSVGN